MPKLNRPTPPKVKIHRLSRKKNLGQTIKQNIGTKSSSVYGRIKMDKKRKVIRLCTCYKNVGVQERFCCSVSLIHAVRQLVEKVGKE